MSVDMFGCHNWGRGSGICWVEARHLLNIPQCTGHPPKPRQQRMIQPQMAIALSLRNCSRRSQRIWSWTYSLWNRTGSELGSAETNATILEFQSCPGVRGMSNTTTVTASWEFTLLCKGLHLSPLAHVQLKKRIIAHLGISCYFFSSECLHQSMIHHSIM